MKGQKLRLTILKKKYQVIELMRLVLPGLTRTQLLIN